MGVPGLGWLVSNYNHSRYETQPSEEALTEAFTEDQYLFGGQRTEAGTINAKVAVTTTSASGTAVVLANYNRLCNEKLPYQFYRPEMERRAQDVGGCPGYLCRPDVLQRVVS